MTAATIKRYQDRWSQSMTTTAHAEPISYADWLNIRRDLDADAMADRYRAAYAAAELAAREVRSDVER